MDIHDKARIRWACRRGMKEVDLALMPFFEYEYDSLTCGQKSAFIELLNQADPDLFNWLMNYGTPTQLHLQDCIRLIQERNQLRGALDW